MPICPLRASFAKTKKIENRQSLVPNLQRRVGEVILVMEHDNYEESETLSEDIINCESDEEGADEYDEDNRIQAAGT